MAFSDKDLFYIFVIIPLLIIALLLISERRDKRNRAAARKIEAELLRQAYLEFEEKSRRKYPAIVPATDRHFVRAPSSKFDSDRASVQQSSRLSMETAQQNIGVAAAIDEVTIFAPARAAINPCDYSAGQTDTSSSSQSDCGSSTIISE